jgi:hypothetical protein
VVPVILGRDREDLCGALPMAVVHPFRVLAVAVQAPELMEVAAEALIVVLAMAVLIVVLDLDLAEEAMVDAAAVVEVEAHHLLDTITIVVAVVAVVVGGRLLEVIHRAVVEAVAEEEEGVEVVVAEVDGEVMCKT